MPEKTGEVQDLRVEFAGQSLLLFTIYLEHSSQVWPGTGQEVHSSYMWQGVKASPGTAHSVNFRDVPQIHFPVLPGLIHFPFWDIRMFARF